MKETLRISEIFGPTLQGEGALIGKPTVFVRTGGCDYRCSWCDTPYAVDASFRHEWTAMTAESVLARVRDLSGGAPLTVSLSGGNPALQPFAPLIALGKKEGFGFAVETQGSVVADWFAEVDVLTLSPKPPSSGMATDWKALEQCVRTAGNGPRVVLKMVVFDEADYAYAKDVAERYPSLPVYLQAGALPTFDRETLTMRMRWLAERTLEDRWFAATVLPQWHVLLWGNKRGV